MAYTPIQIATVIIALVVLFIFIKKTSDDFERERQRKLMSKEAAIERIRKANELGYKPPDDNMETSIENGVIKYKRKKNRK